MAGGLARGVALGLFVLAFAPLILVTPAHATDDNTVSIAVDQNAALQPAGNLYKATTSVTVKTGKPYGFNITMQADTADLINSKDQTHKISATPSTTPVALNANQWGYSLSKSATTFSAVPAGTQATPAVVADVTKAKPAGCTNPANCTKFVTFAANVDPSKLASGSYSTTITYTATAKPKPAPTVDPTICKSGDLKSSCQVDLDPNMIPVKYTGNTTHAEWTSLANPEDAAHQGEWYNYKDNNNKDTKWANAVTVDSKKLSKYKGKTRVVEQSDILGFWVYIPRYRYKVLRFSPKDPAVSAQNFEIEFENKDSTKAIPTATGDWATHPAFTFGNKKLNGLDVPNELNGIWFGKFETTGTTTQPTVLPNERRIKVTYSRAQYIGIDGSYALAKTMGVNDPNNVGGNTWGVDASQNNHHLIKLSSHMANNNDWGAATYLSASKYGAGYNGVQINANSAFHGDSFGTTGCGPQANGDTSTYDDGGTLGTQSACSSSDPQRAYNGTLGQLASTTNNPTGIYDMSGGGYEYVAASYSDKLNNSNTQYFGSAAPPYINTYNFRDFNSCTYQTCGGQALYETNLYDSDGSNQWNNNDSYFAKSSYPWFVRGDNFNDGSNAGLFCAIRDIGGSDDLHALRVALAPAPHD